MNKTHNNFKEISNNIKANIIIIILFALILSIATYFIIKTDKGYYSCYSKIFPLGANKSMVGGPLDAIKSQFGISDKTDVDKIFNVSELLTSRTIARKIIQTNSQNPKFKKLSDWILYDYNSNLPIWEKKIVPDKKDTNSVLYISTTLLHSAVTISTDAKTSFTKITARFHDKDLAKIVSDEILLSLSEYYISFVTAKPRLDLISIGLMRDSLKKELYGLERNIAGFQDSNQFSNKASVFVPQQKAFRNKAELEQLYAVTVTAYQNARFKLLSESPIFQVLDYPSAPFLFEELPFKKITAISFFLFCIIFIIIVNRKVIWRYVVQDIQQS